MLPQSLAVAPEAPCCPGLDAKSLRCSALSQATLVHAWPDSRSCWNLVLKTLRMPPFSMQAFASDQFDDSFHVKSTTAASGKSASAPLKWMTPRKRLESPSESFGA